MPIASAGTNGTGTIASHGYYYIGTTVFSYLSMTDNAGVATNAVTITGTLYLPDNTTSSLSVTNTAAGGLYWTSFVPAMAGQYTLRFVSGAPLVQSFEHTITVKKGATG